MRNLFGNKKPNDNQNNNLFGQGNPNLFGKPKNKPRNDLFGQPNNNLFAQQNKKAEILEEIMRINEKDVETEKVEEEEEEQEDEKFFEEKEPKIDEIQNKKCSLTEHKEINAIKFCPQCNIFMCNKCDIIHSGLVKHHYVIHLDNNANNIFTGICKSKNHSMKLEYFCKDHNQLCCAACIAKIRCKGNGYHKNCKVFYINKIKNNKKNKLNENIKFLEDLSSKLEDSIKELKSIFEIINENKEKLKMQIQTIFTKIRNSLNNREDKLLSEVDKKFDDLFFKEDLIKESEKLPNKIKYSLEKGKAIDNEWNDDANLSSLINDCLNIENDIKKINDLNKKINKCNSNKYSSITFKPEENETNKLLEIINDFGELQINEMQELVDL